MKPGELTLQQVVKTESLYLPEQPVVENPDTTDVIDSMIMLIKYLERRDRLSLLISETVFDTKYPLNPKGKLQDPDQAYPNTALDNEFILSIKTQCYTSSHKRIPHINHQTKQILGLDSKRIYLDGDYAFLLGYKDPSQKNNWLATISFDIDEKTRIITIRQLQGIYKIDGNDSRNAQTEYILEKTPWESTLVKILELWGISFHYKKVILEGFGANRWIYLNNISIEQASIRYKATLRKLGYKKIDTEPPKDTNDHNIYGGIYEKELLISNKE